MLHQVLFIALGVSAVAATASRITSENVVKEDSDKPESKFEQIQRYVMPWMCLEICNSSEEIAEQLVVIKDKSHVLSGVSFEKYTLGDDCNLVAYPDMTDVNSAILETGLENWPMISSYVMRVIIHYITRP